MSADGLYPLWFENFDKVIRCMPVYARFAPNLKPPTAIASPSRVRPFVLRDNCVFQILGIRKFLWLKTPGSQ